MSDLNKQQLKNLYHVALNCCDKFGHKQNMIAFRQDASEARMKLLISVASQKNALIKSYASAMEKE